MFTKASNSNSEKVRNSNLGKLSKKISKTPLTVSERVPEKELQLTKEVSIRCINHKELLLQKESSSPPVCNMPQALPDKSVKTNRTALSENDFLKQVNVDDSNNFYGKDWDEMEFLKSSVFTKKCNTLSDSNGTTSDALNGKYARTRKNLGKRISADNIANGLNKNTSIQSFKKEDSHLSSGITKSNNAALRKLTQQSVLNSSNASISHQKPLLNSASISSSKVKPSLLEIAKRFTASPNLVPSDSPTSKASFPKSSLSFKNYMNKLRSEPPRARSVTNVSLRSLVPESIEISLVPNTSKSPLKNSNSCAKNSKLKNSTSKKLSAPKSKQVEKNEGAIKVTAEKRSSEPVGNAGKKSKREKQEKTEITNETIYNPSLNNSNATETSHIKDNEITSWLDEEMKKGTEELQIKESTNANPVSQVFTMNSGLENQTVINPTSYILTPTLPNTISNTYAPSNMNNNNIIYDVNSFSLYPPATAPPSTTVFILPVSSNFSTVPDTPGYMNSVPPSQPIVKVTCNGMDADSVFKSICKTFYQSAETDLQNAGSVNTKCHETSNTVQTNSIVQTSLATSSCASAQQPGTSGNNSSSIKEPGVREVCTADRGSLVLSYFCELMKNSPKRPLKEYRREANKILDILSSLPRYLSVKYFHSIAEDYFSDLCFCDPSSQCTKFTFAENLEESRLNDVLKEYVSFQVKKIIKAAPIESFWVKSNFLFKACNSKLTYFEKLILKKMLKGNQGVDLKELISRLFFVGLVVVFNVLKNKRGSK